jgi:hypothetical protein
VISDVKVVDLRIISIFSLSITDTIFFIFDSQCCSRLPNEYGGVRNHLHLSSRDAYFGYHQKYFGIGNEIGNTLEHLLLLKKMIFLVREREMSNPLGTLL